MCAAAGAVNITGGCVHKGVNCVPHFQFSRLFFHNILSIVEFLDRQTSMVTTFWCMCVNCVFASIRLERLRDLLLCESCMCVCVHVIVCV